METVTIDGVEYVKASVLAKKHRYTNDYIGQLCRGKKVDAHLVGRTWYVYPPSLEGHKSTRYADLRSGEKSQKSDSEIRTSRISVEAPLKEVPLRGNKPHFHDRVFWKPTAYEADDAELIPTPQPNIPRRPLKMPINLAESERVRVAAVSKNVTMVSQPLPAISLSGTLKVQDFSPDFSLVDAPELQNVVEEVEMVEKYSDSGSPEDVSEAQDSRVEDDTEEKPTPGSAFLRRLQTQSTVMAQVRPPVVLASDVRPPVVASPGKDVHEVAPVTVKKTKPEAEDPRTSLFFRLVIAPAVVLLVASVAATLLAVETVTVVGGGEQVASLRFDPANLTHFLPFSE